MQFRAISKTLNNPLLQCSDGVFGCHFVFCYSCGLPTGRQEGMEEGAELCHCAALLHAGWHQEPQ